MTGDTQHDATAEFNEALAAGFAAGNFDGIGPFYTEGARILPPRGQALEGRAAAGAFWLGVKNRFDTVVFTTGDLKQLGEAVRRETGTYAMSGGQGEPAQGKYLFVWQLVDGEWQIESSIWNRTSTGAQSGRQGQGQGRGQGGQRAMRGGQGSGQGGGQGGGQGAARGRTGLPRCRQGRRLPPGRRQPAVLPGGRRRRGPPPRPGARRRPWPGGPGRLRLRGRPLRRQ